jgi:hypothetical protein
MAKKTLAEAKEVLKTDKIHEVDTTFLVNDFGKYRPNITFVVRKDFERSPIAYRSDEPTREMLANMNLEFGGETSVLFGDYWKSKKGGACFRPKEVAEAKHVLVKCGWGGAFSRTRGIGYINDVPYYRRAASNGGGAGNDYLVVPVGYYQPLHDEEVDGDTSSTPPDFSKRAKAIREAFANFDQEQAEKASAEAKAKAEAEEASRSAKVDLLPRLEAANDRMQAAINPINTTRLALEAKNPAYFTWNWRDHLYTEENVARYERQVEQVEREAAEKERKRQVRETFQPQYESFKARVEGLDLTIEFTDESARLSRNYQSFPYTDEGLVRFGKELERLEAEAIETRRQADAQAAYNEAKAKAEADCLPQNIEIWKRTGGRTNAGNGWVIDQDGQDRDPTSMWNSNPRRLQRYGEGYMVWDQILAGEVVLKWSKSSSAAPHEFEAIHLPEEGLTEAQLERIQEIQDELESEWAGARSLASGELSPPVGEGWGLLPQTPPPPPVTPVSEGGRAASSDQLAALRDRFGK